MSHTKGEWRAIVLGSEGYAITTSLKLKERGHCGYVAICRTTPFEQCKEDAKRIVRCVNSHDELLEACKTAKLWHQGDRYRMGNETERKQWERMRDTIQQAINKAEGA